MLYTSITPLRKQREALGNSVVVHATWSSEWSELSVEIFSQNLFFITSLIITLVI